MSSIEISISDSQLDKVRKQAAEVGLTPEEFLGKLVVEVLNQPEESLQDLAAYLLEKNAELYRRLS